MKRFLPFAILLIALFEIGQTSFVRTLDLKSADLLTRGHFADPDVVILAIDDKSIGAIGRWPWPRTVEATLVNDLAKVSPRAVGIDINFSETEDPADDNALATSMAQAGFPIVLPVETIQTSDGSSQPLYPLPVLRSLSDVSLGHVDVLPATDNDARFLPPAEGNILPFSEVVASLAGTILPGAGKQYAISFAGPAGTFPTYSVSDFLAGNIPPQDLSQKIILVGATANDLHDVVNVPVGNGVMAGVEWHANIIDNLLLNRLIVIPAPWLIDLIAILVALGLLFIFMNIRTSIAAATAVFALIAIPGISYVALRENMLIPFFWTDIVVLLIFFAHSLAKWYATEMEKRRIKRSVQNYFSPAVLDAILKDPKSLSLGGERKEVTILFSDIRSFTTITESTPPEILAKLLHEYFTEMAEEVFATDGVLDKFIGDAIMAFWGAPLKQPDHADRAVATAQGMVRRLESLQKKWHAEGLPFVDIGIGIHTGYAIVGNMGSSKRFDYTVIGDAVNAASRLEGLNKEYKTHIIISDETKRALKHKVSAEKLGDAVVKGKKTAITIYEVSERR